jgi:hypothetical protein
MRSLEKRVAKLEGAGASVGWAEEEAARNRRLLRARVTLCSEVREGLESMGIDPELAVMLRIGKEAAAELAGIPDTPELKAADAAIRRCGHASGGNGSRLREKLLVMAERYRDGHRPDFANASAFELFAFVLANTIEAGFQKP